MAINSTNISPANASGGMAYVLWGSLYTAGNNYNYNALFATINVTSGSRSASAMIGRTQGASPAPGSFSMTGVAQMATKTFNINATCAWAAQNITGNYQLYGNSGNILQGSSGTAVVGGNGTLTIRRTGSSGSGQVYIAWSNGAGGRNIQAVSIIG
jgi:hypothetical protein